MTSTRHNTGVNGYRFTTCRLLGHAWHEVPSDWNPPAGVEPMTVRCERCDMERRDQIDAINGTIVPNGRKYTRPNGYLFSKSQDMQDPPKRVDFRLAWISDQIDKRRVERRN
jgi:hypothetical protein